MVAYGGWASQFRRRGRQAGVYGAGLLAGLGCVAGLTDLVDRSPACLTAGFVAACEGG